MIVFVVLVPNSSDRVCCTRGNAPGCSSASATIRSTTPGSICTPTCVAGSRTASANSSDDIAPSATVRPWIASSNPGWRAVGRSSRPGAWRRGERSTRAPGRRPDEHSEEGPSLGIVDGLREQLLQLIDHDQHAGVAGRQLVDDRAERARLRQQRPDDVGNVGGGDASERCREVLERLAPGDEVGDEPALRPRERPGRERRQQAGLDGGRLADSRRTDDDQQRLVPENGDHLGDWSIATVEVVGVRLLERLEATVRVARRREPRRRSSRYGERVAKLGHQLVDRLLPPARIRIGGAADDSRRRTRRDIERPVERWRRTAQQVLHEDTERVDVGRRRRQRPAESLRRVVRTAGEGDHARADLVDAQVGDERVALVRRTARSPGGSARAPRRGGGPTRPRMRSSPRSRAPRPGRSRRGGIRSAQTAAGHQAAHHHRAVRLAPVVEERYDMRMLDAGDPLRCGLEAAHELRMAHHRPAEDAQRDLATDRRLVRPVDLAELSDTDQLTQSRSPAPSVRHPPGPVAAAGRPAAAGSPTRTRGRRVGRRGPPGRARRCRTARVIPRPTRSARQRRAHRGRPTTGGPVRGGRWRPAAPRGPAAARPVRRRVSRGRRRRSRDGRVRRPSSEPPAPH